MARNTGTSSAASAATSFFCTISEVTTSGEPSRVQTFL
jgi:hypothetical protein